MIKVSAGTSVIHDLEERGLGAKPLHGAMARPRALTDGDTESVPHPCTHSQASRGPPEPVVRDSRGP